MSKTVNYDFEIMNYVTVEAPYGINPEKLLDQAVEKLLSLHKNEIELHCENTFDGETGSYEPIPEEWYDKK